MNGPYKDHKYILKKTVLNDIPDMFLLNVQFNSLSS